LDDPEISEEFTYWFFAHCFGFDQDQVDKMPYDRMVYHLELERELRKREAMEMKH